jgi:hypothetical protein
MHNRLCDSLKFRQGRLDRLGLDWPSTHAYLKILAAQMLQAAIVVAPPQIAGVV